MQRTSTTSSPSLPRTKTSKLLNHPIPGVGSAPSYINGYSRTTKQGHSSVRRPLPTGPGPLPNRPKVNACTFATGSRTIERRSNAADNVRSHRNPGPLFDIDPVSRRRGYDTERGYERRLPNENGHMTFSSRNKSKSLSSLNMKSENSDKLVSSTSTSLRLRTDSYATEKKAQSSSENDHRNFKHPLTKSSVYRSTTHLDYKDHWENETTQSKVHSFASEKDLNSSSYGKGSFMDTEKPRKVTITALPGSDLKSVKKSSLSSSNSSPSVSSINNVSVHDIRSLWLSCPKVGKCFTPVYTVDNSICFESFDLSRRSTLSQSLFWTAKAWLSPSIWLIKVLGLIPAGSLWTGACNSHTKPMSWHFYRLIYF